MKRFPNHSKVSKVRRCGQGGITMLLFGFSLMVLVPMVGLAVDVSLMHMAQTKLTAAADASALAGARALSRGADHTAQEQAATDTAVSYFHKNFPNGYLSTGTIGDPTVTIASSGNLRTVTVSSTVLFPSIFLRWFGPDANNTTINTSAIATRRDVNVVVVLDHSGSLSDSGSCAPMKAAATAFLSHFALGRDNVGLVTFATGSAVDVPLNSSFTSGATDIGTVIAGINCTNSTNSSSGLWRAYKELAVLGQPGALNAILFFTDGMPTSFDAWNHITNTGCSAYGWTAGVIGYTGLGNPDQPAAQPESVLPSTGCSWSSGMNPADVTEVANRDVWGNPIDTTYATVTVTGTTLPPDTTNMHNASINATISAAQRVRSGVETVTWTSPTVSVGSGQSVPRVTIFSIGLGNASTPPDANLLMTVSNDPRGPSPDSGTAQGLYIFAPNANALGPAFQRVASEMLRLAR